MDLTSNDAIRLADDIEAAASAHLYTAAPPSLGFRAERVGGATVLLAPRIPVSYFNRVIGLGGHTPATRPDLEAVIDLFDTAGVKDFWIHLTPAAHPAELSTWIAERGLAPPARRSWAKFLRGAEPAPTGSEADLQIRVAGTGDAAGFARIVTTAFGLPTFLGGWLENLVGRDGWQILVAEVDGQLAATGAVFVRHRTAWLGMGATLSEYRRRGAQTALLAARIAAAAAAGCTVIATETGESIAGEPNPSLANIRRAGFTQTCSRLNYAAKT